ncbi:MAG: hypothetical protein AAFZ92_06120, partial [Pseudomonadota bacterium]
LSQPQYDVYFKFQLSYTYTDANGVEQYSIKGNLTREQAQALLNDKNVTPETLYGTKTVVDYSFINSQGERVESFGKEVTRAGLQSIKNDPNDILYAERYIEDEIPIYTQQN